MKYIYGPGRKDDGKGREGRSSRGGGAGGRGSRVGNSTDDLCTRAAEETEAKRRRGDDAETGGRKKSNRGGKTDRGGPVQVEKGERESDMTAKGK